MFLYSDHTLAIHKQWMCEPLYKIAFTHVVYFIECSVSGVCFGRQILTKIVTMLLKSPWTNFGDVDP